jgi:hypothetical protein
LKYYIYTGLLACCLSVSSPASAQSTSNCAPSEEGPTQFCTFATGQNSSVIATFDCPSFQTPCPDSGAHSIKFTVGNVMTPFTINVTPTKVTGDGVCDGGTPPPQPGSVDPEAGEPRTNPFLPSIDCRFLRFFADPAFNNEPPTPDPNAKVPFCYDYALFAGQPACIVYSVSGPDPGSTTYSGGVQFKIAWNNVRPTPAGYFHKPRMFDDPHNDHPSDDQLANASNCPRIDVVNDNVFPYEPAPDQPEDNQFVCDITTSFSAKPNTVGTDPTSGGAGKSFNDFVIAWRFCSAKQDDVEGDGHEQGDDGHEGEFEFCQRSKHMEFQEPDSGVKMNGSMDAVTLNGNQAIITGAGTLGDGTPVQYTAVVLGNAPVVGANHFAISWITATGLVFQTSGALIDGYIAVPTLPTL